MAPLCLNTASLLAFLIFFQMCFMLFNILAKFSVVAADALEQGVRLFDTAFSCAEDGQRDEPRQRERTAGRSELKPLTQ